MAKDFLYRVILTNGTVCENLTYSQTFDLMADGEWDVVQFMGKDLTLATVMDDD
jgi:hypothetical protein